MNSLSSFQSPIPTLSPHPITQSLQPPPTPTPPIQYLQTSIASIQTFNKLNNTDKVISETESFIKTWKPLGHPIIEYHIITILFDQVIKRNINKYDNNNICLLNNFLHSFATQLLNTYNNPSLLINPTDGKQYAKDIQYNNFQSIRIYIITYIGNYLKNDLYINWGHTSLLSQIPLNLYKDGSSYDFKHRSSMGYHVYNMKPLLQSIEILQNYYKDYDYYNIEINGSSIKKSVNFIIPYLNGEKRNFMLLESQLLSDKKSSNYGKEWDPKDAKQILKIASQFDSTLEKYI